LARFGQRGNMSEDRAGFVGEICQATTT
jgi:hypothetical protein